MIMTSLATVTGTPSGRVSVHVARRRKARIVSSYSSSVARGTHCRAAPPRPTRVPPWEHRAWARPPRRTPRPRCRSTVAVEAGGEEPQRPRGGSRDRRGDRGGWRPGIHGRDGRGRRARDRRGRDERGEGPAAAARGGRGIRLLRLRRLAAGDHRLPRSRAHGHRLGLGAGQRDRAGVRRSRRS